MIKNLILRGVSSYSPEQNSLIGPLTKVNMFYGHNGTGKTTIGNYLQDPADLLYHQCKTQPASAEREVLVYNHTFMEANFYASSQAGIFTLNEGNIEAEKQLVAAEDALKKLLVEHQPKWQRAISSGNPRNPIKLICSISYGPSKGRSIPGLCGTASLLSTQRNGLGKSCAPWLLYPRRMTSQYWPLRRSSCNRPVMLSCLA